MLLRGSTSPCLTGQGTPALLRIAHLLPPSPRPHGGHCPEPAPCHSPSQTATAWPCLQGDSSQPGSSEVSGPPLFKGCLPRRAACNFLSRVPEGDPTVNPAHVGKSHFLTLIWRKETHLRSPHFLVLKKVWQGPSVFGATWTPHATPHRSGTCRLSTEAATLP